MLSLFRLAVDCNPSNIFIPDLYNNLRVAGKDGAGNPTCELKLDSLDAIKILLVNVVHIALALAGLVAVGFIIWGAIQFTMSQGEPERIKKGKETIVNAVVGLFLAILAFVIVSLISNAFTAGGIQ